MAGEVNFASIILYINFFREYRDTELFPFFYLIFFFALKITITNITGNIKVWFFQSSSQDFS